MDISEVLENEAFYILAGIGYGAFAIMFIVLKKMNQADIMPIWVRIATLIAIPLVAAAFSGWAIGE